MNREKSPLQKSSTSGFTLIETAVVVIISALVIAMGTPLVKSWMAQSTVASGQQRMSAIQQALNNYVTQHGRLPCPSSFLSGDPNYGHERFTPPIACAAAAPGVISSPTGRTGPIIPSLDGTTSNGNSTLVFGALPVRDLGLPDSYIADTYGHMYTYAVPIYETSVVKYSPTGGIKVEDGGLVDVTPPPPSGAAGTATYVVVDHGKDGAGTYTTSGTYTGCPGLGTTKDSYNCSHTNVFVNAPFSTKPGPSWFDDMIVYGAGYNGSNSPAPPPPTASACQIKYSSVDTAGATEAGASPGHYQNGIDNGSYVSFGSVIGWFTFGNTFHVCIPGTPDPTCAPGFTDYSHFISPTADAYCTDNTYNAMSGGCTQTSGAPKPAFPPGAPVGGVTNAYGAGVYVGAPVPIVPMDVYGVLLPDGNLYQVVPPPVGHPTAVPYAGPIAAQKGAPGWECNGSSASGMQVQAYVICCPNGN